MIRLQILEMPGSCELDAICAGLSGGLAVQRPGRKGGAAQQTHHLFSHARPHSTNQGEIKESHGMTNGQLEAISSAVVSLNRDETVALTQAALRQNLSPQQILDEGLLKGLLIVGDKWQRKEYFISHVLMAARAMQAGVDEVEPHLVAQRGEPIGRVVLGTVKGDIHDIGKNLVGLMLKAAGFEVFDIGVDQPAENFIARAREVNADLIGCSLIMSVALDSMREVMDAARQELPGVKTIVGGPPLSDRVAGDMGADAYGGPDAVSAVKVARRLVAERRSEAHV